MRVEPADVVDADEPLVVDVPDVEPDLVHVAREHHLLRAGVLDFFT